MLPFEATQTAVSRELQLDSLSVQQDNVLELSGWRSSCNPWDVAECFGSMQ